MLKLKKSSIFVLCILLLITSVYADSKFSLSAPKSEDVCQFENESISFIIKNIGSEKDSYTFDISGDFSRLAKTDLEKISLDPDESKFFFIDLTADKNPGMYDLDLKVSSGSSFAKVKVPVNISDCGINRTDQSESITNNSPRKPLLDAFFEWLGINNNLNISNIEVNNSLEENKSSDDTSFNKSLIEDSQKENINPKETIEFEQDDNLTFVVENITANLTLNQTEIQEESGFFMNYRWVFVLLFLIALVLIILANTSSFSKVFEFFSGNDDPAKDFDLEDVDSKPEKKETKEPAKKAESLEVLEPSNLGKYLLGFFIFIILIIIVWRFNLISGLSLNNFSNSLLIYRFYIIGGVILGGLIIVLLHFKKEIVDFFEEEGDFFKDEKPKKKKSKGDKKWTKGK